MDGRKPNSPRKADRGVATPARDESVRRDRKKTPTRPAVVMFPPQNNYTAQPYYGYHPMQRSAMPSSSMPWSQALPWANQPQDQLQQLPAVVFPPPLASQSDLAFSSSSTSISTECAPQSGASTALPPGLMPTAAVLPSVAATNVNCDKAPDNAVFHNAAAGDNTVPSTALVAAGPTAELAYIAQVQNTLESQMIKCGSQVAETVIPLKEGEEFDDPFQLLKDAQTEGNARGFVVARSFDYYDEKTQEKYGVKVKKGFLYCKSAKDGKRQNTKCPWRINFGHRVGIKCYKITKVTLDHNGHALSTKEYNGRCAIDYQAQLMPEDYRIIREVAEYRMSFRKTNEEIKRLISGKAIAPELLRREVRKCQVQKFGTDSHRIDKLFETAAQIKGAGGRFDVDPDPNTHRIATLFVQTVEMLKYTEVYSDFKAIDGTHGMNMYDLIAIVLTLVDCLGLSIPAGFSLDLSENTDVTVKTLQKCSLAKPQETLMSDAAPAFAAAAEELGQIQILCGHHYQQNAVKNAPGDARKRDDFLKRVNAFVFEDFDSETTFESKFCELKALVAEMDKPKKFVDNLYNNRYKICRFYTKHIFTCGHNATVRSESTNSVIKGGGEFKKELKVATLIDSVDRILSVFGDVERKALRLLEERINKGAKWSKFVDQHW